MYCYVCAVVYTFHWFAIRCLDYEYTHTHPPLPLPHTQDSGCVGEQNQCVQFHQESAGAAPDRHSTKPQRYSTKSTLAVHNLWHVRSTCQMLLGFRLLCNGVCTYTSYNS